MKILIKELAKSQWQVRLDQHAVTFRSEAEARAFTNTLEARSCPWIFRFPAVHGHDAGWPH